MSKHKHPKVNIYDAERMFERLLEQAQQDEHIKKPIAWALYKTWKFADKSLGKAIVVDTGTFAKSNPTQIDLATDW